MTKIVVTPDAATEPTDAAKQIAAPEGTIALEAPLAKPKPKFNPRSLIPIAAIVAAGYFGWQYFAPKPAPTFIQVSGRIEADETDIGAKTGGRVTAISVREGDRVRVGQVVAQIEDLEVNEQLNAAAAQVNSVKQEAAQAQLDVSVADSRIQEATANLQQSKGDSQGRVNQANSLVAVARAQLTQAQAQVGEAQAQIRQAQSELQLAIKDRDRYSQLVTAGAINRQLFDQAQTKADTAQAKLDSARATLAARTAAVKTTSRPAHSRPRQSDSKSIHPTPIPPFAAAN